MQIRELFVSDVTRDIPPVVYFHEQSPAKLKDEVSEYIITGGWPQDHPNHRRVPDGIHEQYVRLLRAIRAELDKPSGSDLPASWISGFYGSGKSIFAKLLGLALDGTALPDGAALAEAWLKRDMSPRASELREAWDKLRQKIDPLAVVFDIGAVARDNEQVHAAAVRQLQRRLGYCTTEPLVADFELRLERDGEYQRFLATAEEVLGQPWQAVKDKQLAEEDFSVVMAEMYPQRYSDPMSWYTSRGGLPRSGGSPEEAVAAIRDMVKFRKQGATVFFVVDEVSQYVLANTDRADRLRAFATALGATLKGRAWLLALGQQKLDESADDAFLVWAKDRFPQKFRVHLASTNIRDVVHSRLLQKKAEVEQDLRKLFNEHRPDLKLYAYGCEAITADEFVEVYPMLPGQIDLILQITSALRTRSARAQGDDQAIRGLLQLLGELFRDQQLADKEVGHLVTLDQIYEVQHTALDSDVQDSMARILSQCADDAGGLMVRAAKAVALLELIQETQPTTAKLVAQCLYDHVGRGSCEGEVTAALEELRRRSLLGYSEKQGYKIQSSAGEEWERERQDIAVSREAISDLVREQLTFLLAMPERPRLKNRPFPWAGVFSDGRRADDVVLVDPRDEAVVQVDFRFLARDESGESTWVKRSSEAALLNRLVWVAGDNEAVEDLARQLLRSRAMVKRYRPRRDSLLAARKVLLQLEEIRVEDLEPLLRDALAASFMGGKLYFRSRILPPATQGTAFAPALNAAATRVLPDLFPHFIDTQVQPAELLQLLQGELSGPSPKFLTGELGILDVDSGRYVPTCGGVVPQRVQAAIEEAGGSSGTGLLAQFGAPPYGYTANVVKACVAGLLRAGKVRIQPDGGSEITAIRDAGVRDFFDKDRDFRRATIFPAGADDIGFPMRARICRFFETRLQLELAREDHVIADAVAQHFPPLVQQLRRVEDKLRRLPGHPPAPPDLVKLGDILEQCIRTCRQTKPTVKLLKVHLDALNEGVQTLQLYDVELTDAAVGALRQACDTLQYQAAQLQAQWEGVPYLPHGGGAQADGSHQANERAVWADKVGAAAAAIQAQLAQDRPWRSAAALEQDVATIREAYIAERKRLLELQEQQVEQLRMRVRSRQGFSTLTSDQSHRVLRPLAGAVIDTTVDAVAPSLAELRDTFIARVLRAENEANRILDEILSLGPKPLIKPLNLGLQNRELASAADVEALLDEIRVKLLDQISQGVRVRLVSTEGE